jgi:hypothetical protein
MYNKSFRKKGVMNMEKTCTGCKVTKELKEFGNDKKGTFGKNQKCKACCKARSKLTIHSQEAIENKKKYRSEWQKQKRPLLNARLRERYIKNIDSERKKANARQKKYMATAKGKAKHGEARKKYDQENPEKIKAQRKVRIEIKSGRMIRPDVCEVCNKVSKTHGHHENYNKPLEVIWMCSICHLYHHQNSRFHAERASEKTSRCEDAVRRTAEETSRDMQK